LACRIAIRRLDLDDIGAEITKLLRRIWTQHDRSAIQNAYAG
jgi:hypothetical protein